jgi:serine/threonine protein kinase
MRQVSPSKGTVPFLSKMTSGTRIGPYEIVAPLGAGGMGQVYRARDLQLDRDLAIKILPQSFASDGDRVMRFEREAKTLAALNHPHIAQFLTGGHRIGHSLLRDRLELSKTGRVCWLTALDDFRNWLIHAA